MAFVPIPNIDFRWMHGTGFAVCQSVCRHLVPDTFIGLLAIMYVFAGIIKFDPDWLSGPVLQSSSPVTESHLLGPLHETSGFALLIVMQDILFDLLIVPAFLKKTKCGFSFSPVAFMFNSYTFHVGIFPTLGSH